MAYYGKHSGAIHEDVYNALILALQGQHQATADLSRVCALPVNINDRYLLLVCIGT